jgi:hypothetical protein
MLLFRSSVLHLMLPQFYERVDRWTHETVTILITRNTFPTLCMCLFIFSYFLKWKNKNIFHFLQSYQKHKNIFIYSISLLSTFTFCYFIYLLYLFQNLVLDNHLVELGTQDKEFVLHVASRERREFFQLFPWSSIFTPSHSCGKNYSCYNTLHLESQQEVTHCLVSSHGCGTSHRVREHDRM